MKLSRNEGEFKKLDLAQRLAYIVIGGFGSVMIPMLIIVMTRPNYDPTEYPIELEIAKVVVMEVAIAFALIFPILFLRGLLNSKWIDNFLIKRVRKLVIWAVLGGIALPILIVGFRNSFMPQGRIDMGKVIWVMIPLLVAFACLGWVYRRTLTRVKKVRERKRRMVSGEPEEILEAIDAELQLIGRQDSQYHWFLLLGFLVGVFATIVQVYTTSIEPEVAFKRSLFIGLAVSTALYFLTKGKGPRCPNCRASWDGFSTKETPQQECPKCNLPFDREGLEEWLLEEPKHPGEEI